MWRVDTHTGKNNYYEAYKVSLNAATIEDRQSKRNVEHELAQHLKTS